MDLKGRLRGARYPISKVVGDIAATVSEELTQITSFQLV